MATKTGCLFSGFFVSLSVYKMGIVKLLFKVLTLMRNVLISMPDSMDVTQTTNIEILTKTRSFLLTHPLTSTARGSGQDRINAVGESA